MDNSNRISWDEYFVDIARSVSKRSTCKRKMVGCVIVRDNKIVSTGYGGSVTGQPHCIDVGCDIDPKTGGCVRTVHAEMNAVIQAAKNGVSTDGATAYITLSPCNTCIKALINAGVKKIIYDEEYRIPPDRSLVESCGVVLFKLISNRRIDKERELFGELEDLLRYSIDNISIQQSEFESRTPGLIGYSNVVRDRIEGILNELDIYRCK